jgi:hypothetical protein
LYAGAKGNADKNTNGSWQKYDNGDWNSVNKLSSIDRPSSSSLTRPQLSNDEFQGLNQDFQDRQRGSFQSPVSLRPASKRQGRSADLLDFSDPIGFHKSRELIAFEIRRWLSSANVHELPRILKKLELQLVFFVHL